MFLAACLWVCIGCVALLLRSTQVVLFVAAKILDISFEM